MPISKRRGEWPFSPIKDAHAPGPSPGFRSRGSQKPKGGAHF